MMSSMASTRHEAIQPWGQCELSEDVIVWVTVSEREKLFGHAGMCRNCPLALAIQAVLLPGFTVEVGLHHAHITDAATGRAIGGFSLAIYMVEFIRAFDSRDGYRQAVPFSTLVKLPRRAVRPDVREAMSYADWRERNAIATARWEGLFS